MHEAFITGSHAYGTPTGKSDVDLVAFMRDADYHTFSLLNRMNEVHHGDADLLVGDRQFLGL